MRRQLRQFVQKINWPIWLPICVESLVMVTTLSFTLLTFCVATCINSSVLVMDCVISDGGTRRWRLYGCTGCKGRNESFCCICTNRSIRSKQINFHQFSNKTRKLHIRGWKSKSIRTDIHHFPIYRFFYAIYHNPAVWWEGSCGNSYKKSIVPFARCGWKCASAYCWPYFGWNFRLLS